ncbi:hypothetical protein [Altibacter sp. HG106]|uniref:hypothetical protein n=1 Tax=Altibacter sp. HG106 TaxID=3023937 RepID=UPI002350942A|nr:hypothetical protein [Altibacter sp. HG106]MDC7994439.1 hypothetical protein [Altibacter sp. HG106]
MSEVATIRKDPEMEETFFANVKLRKALPSDLKTNDENLKIGYPYWQRSVQTGEFDQRTYFLSPETDTYYLKFQLDNEMIYVAVNWQEDEKNKQDGES